MKTGPAKVLCVGVTSPLRQLDPRTAHDAVSHLVLAQVYETPYARSAPPVPLLVSGRLSRTSSGGAQIFSAPVRPGLAFSDGTPVTAEHLVDALRELPHLVPGAKVTARGATVEVALSQASENVEHWLSKRWSTVYLERDGRLLGTGPFMFANEQTRDDEVRLVRNPHYRDPVPLDELVFRVFAADRDGRHPSLVEAMAAGEIHLTSALPRDELGPLQDVRKLFLPGESTAILFFNTQRPPFSNRLFRRGVATAIDRYELARVCHPESPDLSARGLLPPKLCAAGDRIRHDPGEGRALLAQAAEPLPVTLQTLVVWGPRPYIAHPVRLVRELDRQLAAFGIRLEPVYARDPEDYSARILAGDYHAVLGGWIPESDDPVDFLESTLSSEMIPEARRPTALTANFARWTDETTDELVRLSRASSSPADVRAVIQHVGNEAPVLPLMYGPRAIVHTRDVQNFDSTPGYVPSFAKVDLALRA